MQWLAQNWIWMVLGIGVLFFMTRMGGMGGCGMGRSTGHSHGSSNDNPPADRGAGPGTAFDPVSRHAVTPGGTTLSAAYHGRAYYFESRENRDAFEGNPEKYLAGASAAGQAIGAENADRERPHRRGGC